LRGVHEWSSARLTCERSWQFSEELVSLKKAPRSFSPIDDRTPYHVSPPPRPKLKKLVKAMPDLYSTPAEALRIASNIAKLPELLCET
jgi:hypothetical protein